ncbi:kinase-like domain-containing protein [Thamnocephalis sphaerospora]|uniref:Kinase-like domain-containing protein n=1 Tax=Thamnocephalis sphaerospora TaxID=78915 RepID=A0A4P9XQK7_9FUNG|nr:kinase-like domain-containing protein [Thamnocephalis sphaerospora]|eukprot:RKP08327.1 kinase-like domain-containing protein [Thamnocephalis sphaerospora]
MDDVDEHDACGYCALKVSQPANAWEAFALHTLCARLSPTARNIVISPLVFYLYQDESYLVLPYNEQGTLLDHANGRMAKGTSVDEVVAAFFVCELLRAVAQLHAVDILHGNIRPENILVRLDDDPELAAWSSTYDPTGGGGWRHKGVCLIDFRRSVDLRQYASGQRFRAGWHVDASDCPSACTDQGFRLDADWYGCATVAYALLHGRRLELRDDSQQEEGGVHSETTRLAPREQVRAGWDAALWDETFDRLLNVAPTQPDDEVEKDMAALIKRFEDWLTQHSTRPGKSLKAALNRVQLEAMDRATL